MKLGILFFNHAIDLILPFSESDGFKMPLHVNAVNGPGMNGIGSFYIYPGRIMISMPDVDLRLLN